jgi:surface protein
MKVIVTNSKLPFLNLHRIFIILFLIISGASFSRAQVTASDYVTVWNTTKLGTTNERQIKIPAVGEYTVYYESDPNSTSDDPPISGTFPASGTFKDTQIITFPAPGIYLVAIRPVGSDPFHRIYFDGKDDVAKLLYIMQWGTTAWSSWENAYRNCYNMGIIAATDVPVLTNVTTMNSAFSGCSAFGGAYNMNTWDVSSVTDMANLFSGCIPFNQSIDNWDVSHVTNMEGMLGGAQHFNKPLAKWNVSKVTNMRSLLAGTSFNYSIDNWDVGNVTDMQTMFLAARKFNQPLNSWNVSEVTNMQNMFNGANDFNQPLGNWDVSNVKDMQAMFRQAEQFNQSIANWNVGNVIDMSYMFEYADRFNQPIGAWDVSNVTKLNSMFNEAPAFNQPINDWNVSNVANMAFMFYGAMAFDQPLDKWDVRNVINMSTMFSKAWSFNRSLDTWTLNPLVNLSYMLHGSAMNCDNYSRTLIGWANNPATPSNRNMLMSSGTYGPAAAPARNYLVNTKGWTILFDTFDPSCTTFPVKLVSFEVSRQESAALLTWATTEETNSDRFEIQRSSDGKHWSLIGDLPSATQSNVLNKYVFTDNAPELGPNYYRLKMVDKDDTFAYSRIQKLEFDNASFVYPNPAADKITLGNYRDVKSVEFCNSLGHVILKRTNLDGPQIEVSELSPGVYTIVKRMHSGDQQSARILIAK